jgi:glycopeptide antibiotics resistance protein
LLITSFPLKQFAYFYHFNGFRLSMVTDNFFGNIAAFIPFGFLLPLMRKKLTFSNVLLCSLLFSLAVEITQLLFRVGAFDVDDIILNALGGGIGYFLVTGLINIEKKQVGEYNEHN